MTDAACFFERSVHFYKIIRRHIQEEGYVHIQRREGLKSHGNTTIFVNVLFPRTQHGEKFVIRKLTYLLTYLLTYSMEQSPS